MATSSKPNTEIWRFYSQFWLLKHFKFTSFSKKIIFYFTFWRNFARRKKKRKKSLGRTQEAKGTTSVGANSHCPKAPQPIIGQKKRESDTFRAVVSHGGSWAVSVAKLKNFQEKGFFSRLHARILDIQLGIVIVCSKRVSFYCGFVIFSDMTSEGPRRSRMHGRVRGSSPFPPLAVNAKVAGRQASKQAASELARLFFSSLLFL